VSVEGERAATRAPRGSDSCSRFTASRASPTFAPSSETVYCCRLFAAWRKAARLPTRRRLISCADSSVTTRLSGTFSTAIGTSRLCSMSVTPCAAAQSTQAIKSDTIL